MLRQLNCHLIPNPHFEIEILSTTFVAWNREKRACCFMLYRLFHPASGSKLLFPSTKQSADARKLPSPPVCIGSSADINRDEMEEWSATVPIFMLNLREHHCRCLYGFPCKVQLVPVEPNLFPHRTYPSKSQECFFFSKWLWFFFSKWLWWVQAPFVQRMQYDRTCLHI